MTTDWHRTSFSWPLPELSCCLSTQPQGAESRSKWTELSNSAPNEAAFHYETIHCFLRIGGPGDLTSQKWKETGWKGICVISILRFIYTERERESLKFKIHTNIHIYIYIICWYTSWTSFKLESKPGKSSTTFSSTATCLLLGDTSDSLEAAPTAAFAWAMK